MPKLDLAAYKYPTGTIIANRAVTVNGDYKKIAYIPDEMPDTVKWYVKRITPTMKAYVSKFVKPLKDSKPINEKKWSSWTQPQFYIFWLLLAS